MSSDERGMKMILGEGVDLMSDAINELRASRQRSDKLEKLLVPLSDERLQQMEGYVNDLDQTIYKGRMLNAADRHKALSLTQKLHDRMMVQAANSDDTKTAENMVRLTTSAMMELHRHVMKFEQGVDVNDLSDQMDDMFTKQKVFEDKLVKSKVFANQNEKLLDAVKVLQGIDSPESKDLLVRLQEVIDSREKEAKQQQTDDKSVEKTSSQIGI